MMNAITAATAAVAAILATAILGEMVERTILVEVPGRCGTVRYERRTIRVRNDD